MIHIFSLFYKDAAIVVRALHCDVERKTDSRVDKRYFVGKVVCICKRLRAPGKKGKEPNNYDHAAELAGIRYQNAS